MNRIGSISIAARRLGTWWVTVLHAGFVLLCLRFLFAAFRQGYPYSAGWTMLTLVVGGIIIGAWKPRAALFTLVAAVALLNGLSYVGLEGIASPPCLVFAAVYLGHVGRQLGSGFISRPQRPPRVSSDPRARVASGTRFITYCLITANLASLTWQLDLHRGLSGFWTKFWSQAVFGFGDRLYFLTSAFIWLQGLFFFALLLTAPDGAPGSLPAAGPTRRNPSILSWVSPGLAIIGVSTVVFYLFQWLTNIPNINEYTAPNILFSPLEDIFSFGSFALVLAVYILAKFRRGRASRTAVNIIFTLVLFALVAASRSRGVWLAGALAVFLIIWFRLSKRRVIAASIGCLVLVIFLNLQAKNRLWESNAYLSRLVSLVLWQNPLEKSMSRLNLYFKAGRMIQARPLTGFGVGSFELTSAKFGRTGDLYAKAPDFAHNFLLQMAAEMGVPTVLLFLGLIYLALGEGFRLSHGRLSDDPKAWEQGNNQPNNDDAADPGRRDTGPRSQHDGAQLPATGDDSPRFTERGLHALTRFMGYNKRQAVGDCERRTPPGRWKRRPATSRRIRTPTQLEILGITLALVAYLLTQMTANSLNIYITNQFLFWFLMAALLTARGESRIQA